MLRKEPNKVYDPFLKDGLGYKNIEHLKKAIAAQPKMYHGEMLHSTSLKIDSPDFEETLEDAEESQLKMRNKMVQLNYGKSNTLYEHLQKNEMLRNELEKSSSDSKDIQANLLKRIKILENDFKRSQAQSIDFELKLQHQKEKMACDVSWKSRLSTLNDENVLLKTQVDSVVQERENIKLEFQKLFNSIKATRNQHQKELDELIEHVNQKTYAYADVRAQNQDLLMTITELKNKLKTIKKGRMLMQIGVESPNSVRRPKSKDTKSKDRVLKNINDKRSFAHVRKKSSSVRIDSNKRGTMHSNVCQSKASVLNTKIVNVVNDSSNIVCVSCGKDVFLLSHETCVARYALSRYTKVKRALFTTSIAARSKNLGSTSVVAKSRLCVAKTPTTTNKVIQLILWIVDSGCWKHMIDNLSLLRNFIEKFMGTVCFGNDHFAAITGYGDYVQGNLVHRIGMRCTDIAKISRKRSKPDNHEHGNGIECAKAGECYQRGFPIYNCITKKIMETIHVKFDELTDMAFECNNFEPRMNSTNFQVSSEDSQSIPSKLDLDNLFGPLYEEYYATSSQEVSDNSAANTLDNEHTSSSSSIIVEEDEAPQIVSSSAEQVATEPNSLVLNENADEFVQEDGFYILIADFDGNVFYNAPPNPVFEEAESSSTYQDPSNMHEFHQKHRSSDRWTKNHPIEQVIGDPSKPVMTRNLLQTDAEVSMLDASWIESMHDELNQFKRLDD
ncbi:hypothetical protein Tco_0910936 [Tanacetum coccineum]|uniref:Retrovirus-related Pol polyprotein from transposon TNT 1-94-like beta-barrel domain-containing protein n=1 Tax=Tanacetum coccineum TaxID=301880 RepID=A0ABQ5CXJ4_9ASTR